MTESSATASTLVRIETSPVEEVLLPGFAEFGQFVLPHADDFLDARALVDHRTQPVRPEQLVDEVVLAPTEQVRIQPTRSDDHRDRSLDRIHLARAVDVHPAAGLVDMFAERRHEIHLAELKPLEFGRVELVSP